MANPSVIMPRSEMYVQLQTLRQDIVKEVNDKMSQELDKWLGGLEFYEMDRKKSENGFKKKKESDNMEPKVFHRRNSLLTDLWKVPHIESTYNIWVAAGVILVMNTTLFYMADINKLWGDLSLVAWGAGKLSLVAAVWLGMQVGTVVLHYVFQHWATSRHPGSKFKLWDGFYMLLYVIYQIGLLLIPCTIVVKLSIPPISSFALLMEQVRMIMKTHAFIRENVYRSLTYKLHQDSDKDEILWPSFSKLFYFLFAPTLVYRDHYPRTPSVSWSHVVWNFLQFMATVFCTFVAFNRFVADILRTLGREQVTPSGFILVYSGAIVLGSISLFVAFYGLLHCWMNAFAEMLRFGDRMFYEDWWNCKSFSRYYRTWNIVVHDWLYNYVYRDVYLYCGKRRIISLLVTFFISAIVHEYILGFTFKFFYPVLCFCFATFGVWFIFITRQYPSAVWNIVIWILLFLGWGLFILLYSMEWYARANCPPPQGGYLSKFIPRSWTCNIFSI